MTWSNTGSSLVCVRPPTCSEWRATRQITAFNFLSFSCNSVSVRFTPAGPRSGRSISLIMRQRRVITLRPHQREQHVIYHSGSWLSIGSSSVALTLDCSRWLSCRVPLLVGRCAEVHSQRNSADWSRTLAIPMAHLYFCDFFHLGNPFLNDDPHSKPITKSQWRCPTPTAGYGG